MEGLQNKIKDLELEIAQCKADCNNAENEVTTLKEVEKETFKNEGCLLKSRLHEPRLDASPGQVASWSNGCNCLRELAI